MICEVGLGVQPKEREHQQVAYSRGYEEREEGKLTFMVYMYPKEGLIVEEPFKEAEVSKRWGTSPAKLRKLAKEGLLKRYKLDGSLGFFYLTSEIKRAL